MKILITSGLSGGDVGGPAQYGPNLKKSFDSLGYDARIVPYGKAEKLLPVGIRHAYYLLKILPSVIWADKVLALDTFSVGIPSVVVSRVFRKKLIIRVGGDFLYSAHINRTSAILTLRGFYEELPKLNLKEEVICAVTRLFMKKADFLAFNTAWQEEIWSMVYSLPDNKTGVVRNYVPPRSESRDSEKKNFLWAGRVIPEKNIDMIKRVAERVKGKHPEFSLEIVTNEPREKVLEKLNSCYCAVSSALTDICPNFILEAISFNKPFLMTQETGLNEIFPEGGEFLDPKDEHIWEEAIVRMLDEKAYNEYKARLSANTYTRDWPEVASDFINIWKKI